MVGVPGAEKLFKGERRTCGRLALDWGQCAAGADCWD